VRTIESHAAGEPLRVITDGLEPIPGATILEKRRFARERLDGLRRGLMFEPRGHADMYGAIPTEPVTPDGDAGVLFMHNEGWSTMCGHGVIALVTVALEAGLLSARDVVRLDTPAGRVTARPRREGARVRSVAFENVPSFVA
jgi:trans-L-3-hydroxyproline dehydratase